MAEWFKYCCEDHPEIIRKSRGNFCHNDDGMPRCSVCHKKLFPVFQKPFRQNFDNTWPFYSKALGPGRGRRFDSKQEWKAYLQNPTDLSGRPLMSITGKPAVLAEAG